jgi:hypothetical protein
MKGAKWILTGLAAAALSAVLAAAGTKARVITVKIWRVAQGEGVNLDAGDQLKIDRADFYAWCKIGNGKLIRSTNHSDDDGHPGWEFYGEGSGRYVPVRIKINDDDGGLEDKDDYVDVNPRANKKDLHLTFDTRTGRITGDARGRRGQIIHVVGGGDDDKGKLWFSIK